jgi:hypothetical protein
MKLPNFTRFCPIAVITCCSTLASAGVSVPWPGAGAGQPNPNVGYPPVSFWKEEAVAGNNYINAMIDQNGTIYDIHFPGAGGVYGVGTRNEGYSGGCDTFPPFTAGRGQMHINQFMAGLRVDGVTHWMSNPNGVSFTDVTQAYHPTSNSVVSTRRLNAGGNNIAITQYDFAPKLEAGPIAYPTYNDGGTQTQRMLYVQRYIITNNGSSTEFPVFYFYGDWAINGGDGSDGAYEDFFLVSGNPVSTMMAFDNAGGTANSRGEYNPTTFSDYPKDVSLFLGAAIKLCTSVGSAGGLPASTSWRDLGSSDSGQGWIAREFTLNPGQTVEIDVCIAGGFKRPAAVGNVGDVQVRPAFTWFYQNSMADAMAQTDTWWTNWLNSGTTVDTPDDSYDELFRRGLLCTALHLDGASGAMIAGFHNGAYPYAWPRDAVYGAVTLARAGHHPESEGVYRWMRDVTFRDNEPWGKGFWKQKYTTDGYTIWGAPQIDETAVFPWGLWWHYNVTGDVALVNSMYPAVRDAVFTMTTSPSNPATLPFLNFNSSVNLMWSNNIWEDQYNFFIYSNANIIRGLDDARQIALLLGNGADASDFANRRAIIKGGLDARLDSNAEATDISQLGIVYPFQVYSPTDARAVRYIDRINGVVPDTSGFNRPLVNFNTPENQARGWVDLIDRYWGDSYWRGGPWFLSTLWYGLYYSERADFTPNKSDIDNHKYRIDLCIDKLGPVGLGAEQIAPTNVQPGCAGTSSLLYPGQPDFVLQTAWPNAWESMSTFVDAVMAFVDFVPDAQTNTMAVSPKLPTAWNTMTFNGLELGASRVNLTVSEAATTQTLAFTNVTGAPINVRGVAKIPSGRSVCSLTFNGVPVAYAFEASTGRVLAASLAMPTGAGATGTLLVRHRAGASVDFNLDGQVSVQDIFDFLFAWNSTSPAADFNGADGVTVQDIFDYLAAWNDGCP